MKALLIQKYGTPEDVLYTGEAPKPIPKAKELLILIKATTVNDYDWSLVRGKPYVYRLAFGLTKPRSPIPGMEVSGVVESIGQEVSNFQEGDEVFGDTSESGFGTFAEYICLDEKSLLKKPQDISFEEAVSLPHASALAYQSLIKIAKIKHGQKILINGGGGGVGSIGLQLAKLHQCEVTGVDSKDKHGTMLNLGYDHVIDYRETNFTKAGERYDVILDCRTNKPALSYLRALKSNGIYVTIGGTPAKLIAMLFWGLFAKPLTPKRLRILALKPNEHVLDVVDLIREGKIVYTIDGPYPFEEAPRLIQYFGNCKHKGKVVVSIDA